MYRPFLALLIVPLVVTAQEKVDLYTIHRIRAEAVRVAALLSDSRTHVYICGLKGMEAGVDEAFADTCRGASMDWAALKAVMRESGRYHVETY